MRDSQSHKATQSFSRCLMDGDPETQQASRRNRRRSMIFSTLIQAGLLTAAIVVPLFASHTIKLYTQTPMLPPPRGERLPEVKTSGNTTTSASKKPTLKIDGFFEPPHIPKDIPVINDIGDGPPSVAVGPGCPTCSRDGVGDVLPLLSDSGPTAPVAKPPEPAPKPRGPVRVSPPIQEARLIHRVTPVYPPLAKQIRKEGQVELHAIIATDGTVRELKVLSGDALFIHSALEAVRQWRYQPTLLGHEPVEVQTRITVIFILSR